MGCKLAFVAQHTVRAKSTVNTFGSQSVFLQELHIEQFLTSLHKVPFTLLQGKLEIQLDEAWKHGLELCNLAIVIEGDNVHILGELKDCESLVESVTEVGEVGEVSKVGWERGCC